MRNGYKVVEKRKKLPLTQAGEKDIIQDSIQNCLGRIMCKSFWRDFCGKEKYDEDFCSS